METSMKPSVLVKWVKALASWSQQHMTRWWKQLNIANQMQCTENVAILSRTMLSPWATLLLDHILAMELEVFSIKHQTYLITDKIKQWVSWRRDMSSQSSQWLTQEPGKISLGRTIGHLQQLMVFVLLNLNTPCWLQILELKFSQQDCPLLHLLSSCSIDVHLFINALNQNWE